VAEEASRRDVDGMICGHIHEAVGSENIGQTTVVNCSMPKTGKGMMIELEQTGKPAIKLL